MLKRSVTLMRLQQRRTTILLSARIDTSDDQQKHDIFEPLSRGLHVLKSAQKGFAPKAMKLLVLMSTFLTTEDLVRLGRIVWKHGLDENEPSALKSVRPVISSSFVVLSAVERHHIWLCSAQTKHLKIFLLQLRLICEGYPFPMFSQGGSK